MEDESRTASRRGFLVVGGVLVLAGAAGGVVLGLASGTSPSTPLVAHVSAELTAAAAAERSLIATVDAAMPSARGSRRAALRLIRADHVAHLHAIEAAIADARYPAEPSVSASASSSAAPAQPVVVTAERAASRSAAVRAARLTGAPAVLLASIAAAEASHAELLS